MKNITFFILLALLCGCAKFNGQYAAISSKDITLYDINTRQQIIAPNVDESVDRHVVVIIPLAKAPTLAKAIEFALEKHNGDYIKDATIELRSFQAGWLYHYRAWKISGDIIKVNKPR